MEVQGDKHRHAVFNRWSCVVVRRWWLCFFAVDMSSTSRSLGLCFGLRQHALLLLCEHTPLVEVVDLPPTTRDDQSTASLPHAT